MSVEKNKDGVRNYDIGQRDNGWHSESKGIAMEVKGGVNVT